MRTIKQKHYTSRIDVLSEINDLKRQIRRWKSEADAADRQADIFRDAQDPCYAADIQHYRHQADDMRKKAQRSEDGRLVKLQRTLAALDTPPLFGTNEVVLQSK